MIMTHSSVVFPQGLEVHVHSLTYLLNVPSLGVFNVTGFKGVVGWLAG